MLTPWTPAKRREVATGLIAALALADRPITLGQVAQAATLEETDALRGLARLMVEGWVETDRSSEPCVTCGQVRRAATRYQLTPQVGA